VPDFVPTGAVAIPATLRFQQRGDALSCRKAFGTIWRCAGFCADKERAMSTFKVGEFEIEIWETGYPAWTRIRHGGAEIGGFHHKELRDLAYGIERARREINAAMPEGRKDEA
jgi:hypothetical protein